MIVYHCKAIRQVAPVVICSWLSLTG